MTYDYVGQCKYFSYKFIPAFMNQHLRCPLGIGIYFIYKDNVCLDLDTKVRLFFRSQLRDLQLTHNKSCHDHKVVIPKIMYLYKSTTNI